jgi:hypothetical protein
MGGRGVARPKKGEEKVRPKHIGFRAATWVWEGVQQIAEEQGQPASEVAHELMEIGLGKLGFKPKAEPEQPAGEAPKRVRTTRTKRAR